MRKRVLLMLLGVSLLSAVSATRFAPAAVTAQAQSDQVINAPTAVQLQTVFSGLSSTVFITHAHDGTNRLFIIEQVGRIRVAQPGASTSTVFLDISSRVLSGGERGLLGLAFHPQYAINGRFFVYYTRQTDGALTVAEYHVSAADPNVADTTEIALNGNFPIPHSDFANHNGGMMAFGQDGYLYMGTGDGGGGDDQFGQIGHGQDTNILLGKMLRIDVDTPNGAVNYSSPPTNPFYGSTPGMDEIYAYGLRNPWRWSFDRVTSQLICGDVGQNTREEIDIITNGGNYGWRIMEGLICNPDINSNCTPPANYVPPIFDYAHTSGRCSITGGYIYRGYRSTVPVSAYVYGDYCTGEIWQLQSGNNTLLIDTTQNISSFGEDEAGEIYVVGLGGTISRLAQTPAPPACTYALTATGQLFPHSGGEGKLALAAATDCGWLAAANVSWITVKQALGAGNDTLSFVVRDNLTGSPRTGLIRLGGQTFTVLQEGALGGNDCPKTLSPTSNVFTSAGGSGSITLAVNSGCAWQATPSASWITITSNSLGTGNATLTYSVAANATGQARKGTISVGQAVFKIKQRP
ncbi:MAG TPA: PQQ-dependent sugar dehydrogenase [Blastocatellia bacterium]|nr:PQQ-dependent sugar dehydrogenase [Blastocatellia bacterium]